MSASARAAEAVTGGDRLKTARSAAGRGPQAWPTGSHRRRPACSRRGQAPDMICRWVRGGAVFSFINVVANGVFVTACLLTGLGGASLTSRVLSVKHNTWDDFLYVLLGHTYIITDKFVNDLSVLGVGVALLGIYGLLRDSAPLPVPPWESRDAPKPVKQPSDLRLSENSASATRPRGPSGDDIA